MTSPYAPQRSTTAVLALDLVMAKSISEKAARLALLEAGGSLTAAEIGQRVRTGLESLTDAYLRDQLGGALMQAQNTGRRAVFDEMPAKKIYASELLDSATCKPCSDRDGAEYDSLEAAEADYPSGGYHGCKGGGRCRGTLVAVADTEE